MGHTVKLQLFDVAAGHYTAVGTAAVDTSATGYFLVSKEFASTITEPVDGNTVVESLVVMVRGTSLADLRTKITAIYDFCDQVRRYQAGQNTMFGRMYFQPGGSGNAFLARLYEIEARVGGDILKAEWANWEVEVTLIYARESWWEDATLRTIGLAEGYALTDLPGGNFVNLATTAIDGDVPAPINIEILNNYNVASGIQRVYVGGVAVSGSGVLPQLAYEAEDATGGTAQTDAACSPGGAGNTKVELSVTTTESGLLTWELNDPEEYGGMWYRILARWAANTNIGNAKWRWKLLSGSTVIWSGNQFLLENATSLVQEMGEVKLPPVPGWTGTLSLVLWGVSTTGSTVAVTLDYIHLMASGLSQKAVGYTPVEYEAYLDLRSGTDISNVPVANKVLRDWYVMWNPALLGYPGQYERVAFVIGNEAVNAEIARTCNVKLSYRPRYRVVGE